MKILVITSNYPWTERPYCGAFVRGLVWEMARQENNCTVIAPLSVWDKYRFGRLGSREEVESVPRSNATVRVFRPRIPTFSAVKVGRFNSIEVSDYSFTRAVAGEVKRIGRDFDFIYAHFLYPSGRTAACCSREFGLPYVVAHGDFEIDPWYLDKGVTHFKHIAGVVAVSRYNAKFCEKVFGIPSERIGVFPNGVDLMLFSPANKEESRKRLGIPLDSKIVAFVGRLDHGKGPDRVLAAVEDLEDVKLMVLGQGAMSLRSDRIVFQGVVDHERLSGYLSAADVFALPTTGEGSCNAILEAMACGLPVVSSKGEFNDDILNDRVSIRIDPLRVDEIRDAIRILLADDQLRQRMSQDCVTESHRFSIESRTEAIVAWAGQRVAEWRSGSRG